MLAIGTLRAAETSEAAISGSDHFVKFGTNKVHYVIAGKGKHDIVLIHCWAGNLNFWNEQVPALKDKARLILIDLPGHGKSDKPHTAYTMDYFADSALAVMKDAKTSKATLIGHSMGVPVIAMVYKKAPEKVAGLVAADGTFRKLKMPADQAEKFMDRFRSPDYKENVRKGMGAMFTPGQEAARDRVVSEMIETPQYVMISAMEGMFNADQPDWDPGHVAVPVIAIQAPNPMWTDDYKDYVKGLSKKWTYTTMEGVGHWLMLEKPKEFNTLLTDLLRKYGLIDQ